MQRLCRSADRSASGEKAIVFVVVSDPVPHDPFTLEEADRSIVAGYADGVDRSRVAHALESEPWVPGVERESSIRLPRLFLNICRKLAKQFPESGVRT